MVVRVVLSDGDMIMDFEGYVKANLTDVAPLGLAPSGNMERRGWMEIKK